MKYAVSLALFCTCILTNCTLNDAQSSGQQGSIQEGTYRFALQIASHELPFTGVLSYTNSGSTAILTISNGDENIEVTDIRITNDSLIGNLPVFNSALLARIESPEFLTGSFVNYNLQPPTYIAFVAEHGKDYRFTNTHSSTTISGRYKVSFHPGADDEYPAVLVIENDKGKLNATFLTETGDYRFLQGNIMNESVYLSAFDGSHVFYFEAKIDGQNLVNGIFYSGLKLSASWTAEPDSAFELTNPEKLTYVVDKSEKIPLNFPNDKGETPGWEGLNLENKVVILDIFGSWCPNCMDASVALHQLSQKYPDDEVQVIPIAFEITQDITLARERVYKMQKDLGLPQGFLFGGYASKKSASAAFPMLNHIMSFPTIIIIDKNRNIRSIYTGFYGPGTGIYYDSFMENTKNLLDSLVREN